MGPGIVAGERLSLSVEGVPPTPRSDGVCSCSVVAIGHERHDQLHYNMGCREPWRFSEEILILEERFDRS
jgi:hypothetical protein